MTESVKDEAPGAGEVETQIYAALRAIKELGDVELTPKTAFKNLGLTSLDVLTLAYELEDRFGIAIRDAYLDDFRTVEEACATVLKLLAARAA
jgi:acyl carrier protein